MGELEPSHICQWECKIMSLLWKYFGGLSISLTYNYHMTQAFYFKKNWKQMLKKKKRILMLATTISTIVKRREQPKCPSLNEWINKYPYNRIFSSHKREWIQIYTTTWMKTCWLKESRYKRPIVWFHFYEVVRKVYPLRSEGKLQKPRQLSVVCFPFLQNRVFGVVCTKCPFQV